MRKQFKENITKDIHFMYKRFDMEEGLEQGEERNSSSSNNNRDDSYGSVKDLIAMICEKYSFCDEH